MSPYQGGTNRAIPVDLTAAAEIVGAGVVGAGIAEQEYPERKILSGAACFGGQKPPETVA
jgi:hypothetical protein